MKGTLVLIYLFAASWLFAQEDVNRLIADAEHMEKKQGQCVTIGMSFSEKK